MKIYVVRRKAVVSTLMVAVLIAMSGLLISYAFNPGSHSESYSFKYENIKDNDLKDKVAYLTFDDGPSKYTPEILDILDEYKISATFFVVGNTEYTSFMKDIVERGHQIGLHSYSHKFEQIYRSSDAFFTDLKEIDDIVYNETGIRAKIMRFPGGSSVKRGAAKAIMEKLCIEVQERGYQYFDWNCDSADAIGVKTVSGALARIKKNTKQAGNLVIVLMHDTEKVTINSLPAIIEYLKEEGFKFDTLNPASPAVHHSW